jgi:hypothetical protein
MSNREGERKERRKVKERKIELSGRKERELRGGRKGEREEVGEDSHLLFLY